MVAGLNEQAGCVIQRLKYESTKILDDFKRVLDNLLKRSMV